MNKNFVRLAFCAVLCIFLASTQVFGASSRSSKKPVRKKYKAVYQYNSVPLKQPEMTKSMASGVKNYNSGNYVSAMLDFEELLKNEPKNTYAQYYLALTYTQLGYRQKAEEMYRKVIDSNSNYALSYYSKVATTCINNPNDTFCLGPKKPTIPAPPKEDDENYQSEDDITNFIRSGKTIHPSAMDKITKERMERKFQADMYELQEMKKNEEQNSNP